MTHNPLTLTRQELYDLVWARLMSAVAKDFNMSDVALAKRCRAVDVPVPRRAYRARKAAGQAIERTPLPEYRSRKAEVAVTPGETPLPEVLREGDEPTVQLQFRPAKPEDLLRLAEDDDGLAARADLSGDCRTS